jgi:hypothetical protein
VKDSVPAPLVDLLVDLGLADAAALRGMSGRVRRLAGGLPPFESLWIDALAQARLLTPWQAMEINAGRGPSLKIGPFVVFERLVTLGYATVFRARQRDGGGFVRLAVASNHVDHNDAERRLALLVSKSEGLDAPPLSPVTQQGLDGGRLWAASVWFAGRTARQWMMGHGRLPPAIVLEIARQMLVGLGACERSGIIHADVGADQLWFDARGAVRLPEPGLRHVLRPMETRQTDLPADCYDYLAPERVAGGRLCDTRGDVFACGALWWHLLTGRPPFAGATAEVKVHSLRTAKLPDIRQLAPETPEALADTVMRCLARDAAQRPESLADVAAALGEATVKGEKRLARYLSSAGGRRRFRIAAGVWRRSPPASSWVAAVAGALLAMIIIAWPAISPRLDQLASDAPPERLVASTKSLSAGATRGRADFRVSAFPGRQEAQTAWEGRPTESGPRSFDRGKSVSPPNVVDESNGNLANTVAVPDVTADAGDEPSDVDHEASDVDDTVPFAAAQWPSDEIVQLSANDPPIDLAQLNSGQTLRGDPARRPTIEVPPDGLTIVAPDVTLENIDFVARQPLSAGAALLTLRELKTTLRGCSFQTADELPADEWPAAIRWDRDIDPADASADLSTGELQISDVTFRRVAAGVTCRLAAGMVLRFDNVLCLEAGPAAQFDRFPEADELVVLGLNRLTLRGARSLIEVGCDQLPAAAGHLEVEAVDCAFVLPAAAALVLFHGEERPGPLLHRLRWSGQGSVLSPRSRLAIWRMPEGRMLAAADDAVHIEGVVRGEVGFAGSMDEAPSGSRIVRWQAPLNSPHPPGIDDSTLHVK